MESRKELGFLITENIVEVCSVVKMSEIYLLMLHRSSKLAHREKRGGF